MAKKFLTQIDMNGLEIRNFLVHVLASEPTSAAEGTMYYNSGDHKLYYKNNSAWVPLTQSTTINPATENPAMDGTAAVGTSAKYAREDHVHPTDTSRAASSHAHGNITSGGDITATAPAIANGDQIIINDNSASKVTNGPTFDGSTTTKALTPKGTWETFATVNTDTKVTQTPVDNNVTRPVILAYDASYDELTNTVSKSSSFTYNASTKALVTGGTVNGYTLAAASEKAVDTSISSGSTSTNLPTSAAVATYVSTQIGAVDAMVFKGGIAGTSTSPGAYTPAADCGHTYRVTTAGYIDGIKVEVGDILICNTDSTAQATSSNYTTVRNNWTFIQANLDGAVTGSGTSGYLTKWNGTGTVTNGPQLGSSTTTYLRNDGSWDTPTDNNYTTTEKNKLAGIASGAEVNQNAFSNVKVGSTTIAADGKTDTLELVAGSNVTLTPDATNDKVTIAATDTTYSNATTLTAGLMSAEDKTYLGNLMVTGVVKSSYTTFTPTSGALSTTVSYNVLSYSAYDNTTNEEVILDVKKSGSNTTFSVAQAYSNGIKIYYEYLYL